MTTLCSVEADRPESNTVTLDSTRFSRALVSALDSGAKEVLAGAVHSTVFAEHLLGAEHRGSTGGIAVESGRGCCEDQREWPRQVSQSQRVSHDVGALCLPRGG